jgi:hypothetical protein
MHDVDEDLKTIAQHGGFWGDDIRAGITHRLVFDSQTDNLHAFPDVASLKIRTHYLNNEIVSYKVYMNFKF